jgi:hypothetical protein
MPLFNCQLDATLLNAMLTCLSCFAKITNYHLTIPARQIVGLGGMAQGPCGEQFKESFSCFVYSTAEPKGVDCVENFRAMQDCFRQHPDIYGNEIDDDEDDEEEKKEEEEEKKEEKA